jgi:hypothetical protein
MLDERIKEAVHFHVRHIQTALGKIEQGVDVTDRIIADAKDIAELLDSVKTASMSSIVHRVMSKSQQI